MNNNFYFSKRFSDRRTWRSTRREERERSKEREREGAASCLSPHTADDLQNISVFLKLSAISFWKRKYTVRTETVLNFWYLKTSNLSINVWLKRPEALQWESPPSGVQLYLSLLFGGQHCFQTGGRRTGVQGDRGTGCLC